MSPNELGLMMRMEEMAAFKLHRFNRILRIAKVIVLRFPIDDCARERFLEAVPGLLHGLRRRASSAASPGLAGLERGLDLGLRSKLRGSFRSVRSCSG
jgi:hypothetical protein